MVKKICSVLALCMWMFCIFSFSAQPAEESSALSDAVKERIVEAVQKVFPDMFEGEEKEDDGGTFIHIIRKSAHFIAYLILGILAMWTLSCFNVKYKKWLIAFLFCVVYAISDEIHQIFVPGRAGRFTDVCIDSAGAALGILFFYGIERKKLKKS